MATFSVEAGTHDNMTTREVEADYYVVEDGFVTFKDSSHKQVASFNDHNVIGIVKAVTKPVSVGTATVAITPVMDTDALEALMVEIERRVTEAASNPLGSWTVKQRRK